MSYNPEIHHRRSIRLKGYDYSQEGLYFITICLQDRECLFGEIVVGAPLRGRPESNINGCPNSESDTNGCPNSEYGITECKQMILNDAGKMAERWYRELENKYPDKRCHEMVIMPNHFHCIIENMGTGSQTDNGSQTNNGYQSDNGSQMDNGSQLGAHVGAPLRGRPIIDTRPSIDVNMCPIINVNDRPIIYENGQPIIDVNGNPIINENGKPSIDINTHPFIDENGQPIFYENGHPIISECEQQNDIKRGEPNDEKYGLHNKKYNVTIGNLVDWFKTMTTNEYIRGVKQYGWKRFDGKLWQRNYYEYIIPSTEEYERIADYITENPEKWQSDRFFK